MVCTEGELSGSRKKEVKDLQKILKGEVTLKLLLLVIKDNRGKSGRAKRWGRRIP